MTVSRHSLIAGIPLLLAVSASARPPVNVVAITQWAPVTEEERNLKVPKVDPDAGAEVLFWRVHVVDELQGRRDPQTILYHYLRIKVFNQRGCESQSTQDIIYSGKHNILDVAGRTIKPDGTIVELKKDAVFKRDIIRASGAKVKAVSFAMPAVEPGVIIEYHWREVRDNEFANYLRVHLQRDIPVQQVTYFIRPLYVPEVSIPPMRWLPFLVQTSPLVEGSDGFFSSTLKDVPAFKEEPLMPSEWIVRPWALLYYSDEYRGGPDKFWAAEGKKLYSSSEQYLKTSPEVRQAAEEAVAGAADPEQKLARILQYCQTKIKRLSDEDVTEQQREKAKENDKPAETLKRGLGSGYDIDMAFAAMARSQGFEARVSRLADRTDIPFEPKFLNTYFMHAMAIAVKVGDHWRFYDPAAKRLPAGMLRWQAEGAPALISDPKEAIFVEIPFTEPEKSLTERSGQFDLDEEGALSGEVHLAYTGHAAAVRREEKATESATQREDDFREQIRHQLAGAEVSDVKIENFDDPNRPLAYSYRVKVPGYAQRTGKRLFVQLDYFERGHPARFTASDRKHPVCFEYPWSQEDKITIRVPPGFALENAEAPASIPLGQIGEYTVSAKAGSSQLIYSRKLVFGRGGRLFFPTTSYPALKQAFDAIHGQDQHMLTLRQQQSDAGK